ncbi:MAG: SPOR domain-containing protein [Calditrichaceae bacterium]|jgi:hypothetical protein
MKYFKITLLIFLFISISYSQDLYETMYNGYISQDYNKVKSALQNVKESDQAELKYKFYSALFNKNGEEAKETFQIVFDNGQGRIKALAAKKLMDYYYAKGYYLNASKYQKYLIEDSPAITPSAGETNSEVKPVREPMKAEINSEKYYIQVGAFSLKENAKQLIRMLATQNIIAKMVDRTVDQRNLYCVWLEGMEDFKETYDYANVIKEKYDLKFRIIK